MHKLQHCCMGVPLSTAAAAASTGPPPPRLSNRLRSCVGLPPILHADEQGDRVVYSTAALAAAATSAARQRGGSGRGAERLPPSMFCNNVVSTAKYSSPFTFVPLFLLESFTRFANFYFLVVRSQRAFQPPASQSALLHFKISSLFCRSPACR